jgi:hypothetical protein
MGSCGGTVSDASQLVQKIRLDLKPLDGKILGHPYLHALEEGRVSLDSLKVFAGQQHHIISSDLRSIALILSREGMRPSRDFLMNILQGEAAALDALRAFAEALGLNTSDLDLFEPLPAAHAYCTFVAWLSLYGSDAELAGALLVNFPAWGANCGRMRAALREKYDLAPSAVAFFDLFAEMPSFEPEAIAIVQSALDQGLPAHLIQRAARLLQGYELMFWDAMAGVASIYHDRGE